MSISMCTNKPLPTAWGRGLRGDPAQAIGRGFWVQMEMLRCQGFVSLGMLAGATLEPPDSARTE